LNKDGVFDMKYRRRIYYSAVQRAEIWDRWQRGESMSSIGRAFDRQSSSVFSVISPTGGIRSPDRKRSKQALSLSEREEISRGLSIQQSLRAIARHLGRAPSTISREVRRNGGRAAYRATASDQAAWDRALRPKTCKLACHPSLSRAVSVKLRRKWSGFAHLLRSLFWVLETGFFKFPDASKTPSMKCAGNFT
jgi:DNA-binding CsgD family transcriptional regulator